MHKGTTQSNANSQDDKLEKTIGCIKYTLFCFTVIMWLFGAALFGLTIWIKADSVFEEWINVLDVNVFYIGIYVLLGTGLVMMVAAFIGCISALMENVFALLLFSGVQVLLFILLTIGSAILMIFGSRNSAIQEILRDSMWRLIMHSEHPHAAYNLKLIQENIGCCGAYGANDYLTLRKPLPIECRDTVTGNCFFNGCIEEMTWHLEDRSGWVVGLAMSLAFINIIGAVMSLNLIQAVKKEEKEARTYN